MRRAPGRRRRHVPAPGRVVGEIEEAAADFSPQSSADTQRAGRFEMWCAPAKAWILRELFERRLFFAQTIEIEQEQDPAEVTAEHLAEPGGYPDAVKGKQVGVEVFVEGVE